MTRLTIALVSVACLFAQALPGMVVKEVIPVSVPAKPPRMWLACDKQTKAEITEVCRMRSKAI